jgi:hypothetical protein
MRKSGIAAFSVSVCQLFKALIANDSICPFWNTFDIKAFVLLHKLEMQKVT